jgi:hypothetical protein
LITGRRQADPDQGEGSIDPPAPFAVAGPENGSPIMPDDVRPLRLTTDQCQQRAKLVRNFAKGVKSELLRQDLLDIAAEYERFADERTLTR